MNDVAFQLYGQHGITYFFIHRSSVVGGKKKLSYPYNWPYDHPLVIRSTSGNAVSIRTGYNDIYDNPKNRKKHRKKHYTLPLVVLDADDKDAIQTVDKLLDDMCDGIRVPQVQSQRGESGRHYYFRADGLLSRKLTTKVGLVINGEKTKIDLLAGYNGVGVGNVLAPPTALTGGGEYKLLDGPPIHEAPHMPVKLARFLLDIVGTKSAKLSS